MFDGAEVQSTPGTPASSLQNRLTDEIFEETKNDSKKKFTSKIKINHQKLVLDVDIRNKGVVGYTDIHTIALENLEDFRLHCDPQIHISGIGIVDEYDKISTKIIQTKLPRKELRRILPQDKDELEKETKLQTIFEHMKLEEDVKDDGLLQIKQKLQKDEKKIFRIYFEVVQPKGILEFDVKNQTMYTQNEPKSARKWFPCLDTLSTNSLSTFDFEITCEYNYMAICSGDLVKQEEYTESPLKTYHWSQKTKIVPQSVGLVVGALKFYIDNDLPHFINFYQSTQSLKNVKFTNSLMHKAFSLFEEYLGVKYTDLFGSYKQVYLDSPSFQTTQFASLSLIDSDLILDQTIIDGSMEMFLRLARLLSLQFFSCFLMPKNWSDIWLLQGFAGYLELIFLQKEFGKNEFKYQFLKAAERLNELETHKQPLFSKNYIHPSELLTEYMKIKSAYVIHMIGKFVSLTNLKKYMNKLIVATETKDDYSNRFVSTKSVIKILKNTYGVDLKHFFEYWVYSTGIPILHCGYKYDVGRSIIEIDIKQEIPYHGKLFNGNFVVRVHETEGTIDYTIPLEDEKNHFEFVCRSKAKKKQRKKVVEAGKEATDANRIEVPIKWFRIDPECDWLRVIKIDQSEEMWSNQLEMDKDVIAQSEAATNLGEFNDSPTALTKLENAAYDKTMYYRIRIEALESMSKFPEQNALSGVDLVIKYFKTLFYDKKMTYLKPNDFSNFQEYFIKKELPLIIVKESNSQSILKFLLEILKNNDNSENKYSDCYYVGNIIKALGMIETTQLDKVLKHVKRILVMDSLLPTPKNILTCYCLYSFSHIEASGRDSKNFDQFMELIKFDNIFELRKAGFQCMINIITSKKSKYNQVDSFVEEIFKILFDENENKKYQIYVISTLNEVIRQIILIKDKQSPLGKFIDFLKSTDTEALKTIQKFWGILRSEIPDYSAQLRRLFVNTYYLIWKDRAPNSCSKIPYDEEEELKKLKEADLQAKKEMYVPQLSAPTFPFEKKRKLELQKQKQKKKKVDTSKVTIKLGDQTIEREIDVDSTAPQEPAVYYTPEELKQIEIEEMKRYEEELKNRKELQERDKKIMNQQIEIQNKIREDRKAKGHGDRTVLLIGNSVLTVRLYETPTAENLFKSLPITATEVSEEKGVIYFPCPGMQICPNEDHQRQVVTRGELAYWVEGNSICIGHGNTPWTAKGTSDIVLYQPCNIFGITSQSVKKLQDCTDIIIERPRRMVIEFEKTGLKIQVDIGLDQASNYVYDNLPIPSAELVKYGQMRYFSCYGNPQGKPSKKTPEDIYRNYLLYGEVAFWPSGNSIILGSGPSEQIDPNHPERILLLESCYVFGRIVSDIEKISEISYDVIKMYKRSLKISINDQITLVADLNDSITSDIIYQNLPMESSTKLFGNLVYFDVKMNEKIPIESNCEKIVLKPEDLAFWVDKSNICICWGKTENSFQDEPRLSAPCNVFGRIRKEFNVIELLNGMNGKEDLKVKIEEYNHYENLEMIHSSVMSGSVQQQPIVHSLDIE
eukprot:gene5560-9378_t